MITEWTKYKQLMATRIIRSGLWILADVKQDLQKADTKLIKLDQVKLIISMDTDTSVYVGCLLSANKVVVVVV